jgi:hypothetical protein
VVDMAEVDGDGLEVALLGGVAREAVVDFFDFLGVEFGFVFGVVKGELMTGAGSRLIGQVIVYVEKTEVEGSNLAWRCC